MVAANKRSSKKFVVTLSSGERVRLEQLINTGTRPAKQVLKARILLKADVSNAGEGWSDSQIMKALDTNRPMVLRVRRQWATEGLDEVLSDKRRAACARPPVSEDKALASLKKYVVRLSAEERLRLDALLNKGKSSAKQLLKARILLKADVSEAGDGWSDGRIVEALDTNISMVSRVRQQLVEEGLDAVLSRKQRATPAIQPIFDGEKEARLTALACSTPPEGRGSWSLRLLEEKVVELGIVERASDNTIGRVLKKTGYSLTAKSSGSSRPKAAARS